MDPFTLIALGIAALVTAAVVSWAVIENWINSNKVSGGTARIVRERIASGKYRVVAGVFDQSNQLRAHNVWEVDQLDADLDRRLTQGGGEIVVYT
ncbi:hypothetical protein ACTMTJ_37675 [Phytohabitans sp. LJ34]|uniref:hypothetical protein n=1 Tax=Phytohabitans sp. LJ34 TaxID=3452217 RepID=UPI003F8A1322